jgi:hypothetical protein
MTVQSRPRRNEFAATIERTDTRLRQELRSLEAHQHELREARQELGDMSLSEQQLASERTSSAGLPAAGLQALVSGSPPEPERVARSASRGSR